MDSSVLRDDFSDYDIISNTESSSIADLHHVPGQMVYEPTPSQAARDRFETAGWSAEDVRAYVANALENLSRPSAMNGDGVHNERKTIRVYVDGAFDGFNVGHALRLRQAKLSFPSVHLIVGVFSDEQCGAVQVPHVERCECVRHCRWVDEVMDGPWTVDERFMKDRRIDYVAVEEGISVDPACSMARVKAYDALKFHGQAIPTRRTDVTCRP